MPSWTDEDVIEAIRTSPAAAKEVLVALPWGDTPLDADGIEAAARLLGRDDIPEFWLEQLRARGLVAAFVRAMGLKTVPIGPVRDGTGTDGTVQRRRDRVDPKVWSRLMLQSSAFRCRIRVNGATKGSGCLVGPGLVLTAWHVIAVAGPKEPQEPAPDVSVELSDGRVHPAFIPPKYQSPCGDTEWGELAPADDLQVDDRHDVALLTLSKAAARHLGYAAWPATPPAARARMAMALADYPEGVDMGLGQGLTKSISGMTARFLHSVETGPGSSGGACFASDGQLLGLHQGLRDGRGMLVPLSRFASSIAEYIADDIAPRQLWRLGEDPTRLVFGRNQFCEAIAEAAQEVTPVRGVWVKRTDVSGPEIGLGYSFDILQELLLRRGPQHSIVRIPLDAVLVDMFRDVARRLEHSGFSLKLGSTAGSDPTQTAPEAAARAAAGSLAFALNAAATEQERFVWLFVDNPSVAISEPNRLQLEALMAAFLIQPRVRLVLTGMETAQLAGESFQSVGAALGSRSTGLVQEYVGTFTEVDVRDVLTSAAMELGGEWDPESIRERAEEALDPLAGSDMNGFYPMSSVAVVVERLQPHLEHLARAGGRPA